MSAQEIAKAVRELREQLDRTTVLVGSLYKLCKAISSTSAHR